MMPKPGRPAPFARLLRAGRLVDLHAVARQGVRVSVERYSLKDLERFAGYERAVDLRDAARARRRIEAALDDANAVTDDADRALVEAYNREDCEATEALRDWLEALNYHRREENCGHWEFFRLHDLDADALLDERKAITGLVIDGVVATRRKIPVHRYRYPPQETALGVGDTVYEVGAFEGDLGTVAAHDLSARTIDIKKRKRTADVHPVAVMVDDRVSPRFVIWPPADTRIKEGIVQPANGQPGGGVEVIFVDGSPSKTVTRGRTLPDL